MFGTYALPVHIELEGIDVDIKKTGDNILYRRSCGTEIVEKQIFSERCGILINPVEPLNKPKEITPYFLVEFERPVILEPKAVQTIHVTFPVEIGVFMQQADAFENLDILTLAQQKYTLYGDPSSGMLCRFWKSPVSTCRPALNPLREGVMELTLTNTTGTLVEVTKAVFNAHAMKIYYDQTMVSLKASMKISGSKAAETDFYDSPLTPGMSNSIELYTARKLLVISPKCVMTEGI